MRENRYRYNRHSFAITTQPLYEPVSVAQMKDFLRIDGTAEDAILPLYISAARKSAENYTGKTFINTTRTLTLDNFPQGEYDPYRIQNNDFVYVKDYLGGDYSVDIPFAPLSSVSHIYTYDTNNSSALFGSSNYFVDTPGNRVVLKSGVMWPSSLRRKAAVKITYVAGYGSTASAVPDDIKMAVRQHAADMYNCRGLCAMSCECMGMLKRYTSLTETGLS